MLTEEEISTLQADIMAFLGELWETRDEKVGTSTKFALESINEIIGLRDFSLDSVNGVQCEPKYEEPLDHIAVSLYYLDNQPIETSLGTLTKVEDSDHEFFTSVVFHLRGKFYRIVTYYNDFQTRFYASELQEVHMVPAITWQRKPLSELARSLDVTLGEWLNDEYLKLNLEEEEAQS